MEPAPGGPGCGPPLSGEGLPTQARWPSGLSGGGGGGRGTASYRVGAAPGGKCALHPLQLGEPGFNVFSLKIFLSGLP